MLDLQPGLLLRLWVESVHAVQPGDVPVPQRRDLQQQLQSLHVELDVGVWGDIVRLDLSPREHQRRDLFEVRVMPRGQLPTNVRGYIV